MTDREMDRQTIQIGRQIDRYIEELYRHAGVSTLFIPLPMIISIFCLPFQFSLWKALSV